MGKNNVTQVLRNLSYTYYGYQASWEKDSCYLFFFNLKNKFFCVCAEYASIFVVVGTGWAEDLKRNGGILNLLTDFFWMVFEYVLTDSKLRKHPHHHFTTLHWCCTGSMMTRKKFVKWLILVDTHPSWHGIFDTVQHHWVELKKSINKFY